MDVKDTTNEKCRFCHEGATEGFPLFYPCKCAGSIKYIHKQCLDKWLRHSNKPYCNICKEKYAYRTVYASTMPKTMPIIVTLQQMYTVISYPLHTFIITAFVVLMWTMVFPYILYWTLRALMATNKFVFWTETNETPSAVGQRFIASTTWKEWYKNYLGSTTSDVVSFTGIYDGTSQLLGIMYMLVTLVLKPALWLLAKLTFNFLSNSMKDSIVEIVFEFIVKATEGYSLLLIGLLAKPAMLKAYRFISKECFADTNRNRINEATDADDFANRDQMLPQEIGNDLVEDNRHHNEAIGPRIQPMQANINVAEERVEPVRDELQAEQQPEPVIAINIDWIDRLGFFGIDRSTLKLYLFALFNAQITIALLVWMPYTFGKLFIAKEFVSTIDGLACIYSTIWNSIVNDNKVTMICLTFWWLGFHALSWITTRLKILDFATMAMGVLTWLAASDLNKVYLCKIKEISAFLQNDSIGRSVSKLLLQKTVLTNELRSESWQTSIAIGYAIILLSFWAILGCVLILARRASFTRKLIISQKTISFTIILIISMLGLPIFIGYITHISLKPLLFISPIESIGTSLQKSYWFSACCHVACGWVFMFAFVHIKSVWRLETRPGFMWYIKDINQVGNGLQNTAVKHNLITYFKLFAGTISFFIGITTVSITFPLLVATRLMHASIVININSWSYYSGHMEIILGLILAITLKSTSHYIANVFKKVLIWISTFVAYYVGLTEYVTGQINILDEGRWSIKYVPWLPIPLSSICMPNHIVQNVFKQESAKIFDMARVGRIEQALPSDEYYAHMQQAIDSALKSTYFLLAFTLQPNNMRVPGKHFMTIPNNRVARVPVNNFGLPVDSIYDYEVADNPQKRKRAISEGRVVPYPAINNVKVDMSFKAMDYSVVYVPSMFELRELVYMALTLFGLGMVIVLTLALALYIGGYILHPMYSDLRETASPFYLGLLVILAIGIAVIRGLRTFEKVFTFEKGLMKTLQIVFQNALEISRCTLNVLITIILFAGVIPTLACIVIEIYYGVLHRYSNDNFYSDNVVSTSMWDLITRVWLIHIFTVIICASASYMLSTVDWINHMVLLLWQNPQKWTMPRIICVYAAPAIFRLAAATGLPVALGLLRLAYNDNLTMDKACNILLLNDTTALAPNVRLVLLAIIGGFAALKGSVLYKKCADIVRIRLYSLGQVLENIDGSNTPLSVHVSSE